MNAHPRIPLLLAMAGVLACGTPVFHPAVLPPTEAPPPAWAKTGLKVHLTSGDLFVLATWQEEGDTILAGTGDRYDPRRALLSSGSTRIRLDSIALLEVSTEGTARPLGLTLLPVWTVMAGFTTGYCLIDPKACFGSCPTFYSDDNAPRPLAEGFSASVARSLEARDVDELPGIRADAGKVRLVMRNEALETHAVRSLELLAVPAGHGEVFATPDERYFGTTAVIAPTACNANAGNCLDAVRSRGGAEYRTVTDSTDLAAMEVVELTFPAAGQQPVGLVLGARQSFVSTYLLYQTMAYAGSRAADWLLALERRGTAGFGRGFETMELIGTIEVEVWVAGGWVEVGRFGEPGPLATDVQLLPLPPVSGEGPIRIRLTMARGGWRLDYAALATLTGALQPVTLDPSSVFQNGTADSTARHRLLRPDQHLVTYPGDRYVIEWTIPVAMQDATFFLASTGYYYEWMRPEWVREENPSMLMLLATNPREALRRMAPGFKELEPKIDALFWSSRYHGGK